MEHRPPGSAPGSPPGSAPGSPPGSHPPGSHPPGSRSPASRSPGPERSAEPGPPHRSGTQGGQGESGVYELDIDPPGPTPPRPAPAATSGVSSGGAAGATTSGGGAGPPSGRRASKDRLTAWVVLLTLVCLGTVPLWLEIQRPPLTEAEAGSIAMARAMNRALADPPPDIPPDRWTDALAPRGEAGPRWAAPPLTVWLDAAVLRWLPVAAGSSSLDKASVAAKRGERAGELPGVGAGVSVRLWVRGVSAAFALVTVAGLVWAGFCIGGLVPASLAGLVLLAMPAMIVHGRLAGPTTVTLAWTVLATASALWAIRPFRPTPGLVRRGIGWLVAGGCLALAVLSGGPGAAVPLVLPLVALGSICPRQIGNLLGLLAMVCVGALVLMPWVLLVNERDPGVWMAWWSAVWPGLGAGWGEYFKDMGLRVLWLLLVVGPWTPWALAALAQPLSTSSKGVRTRMFLGWAWFVSVLVLVLIDPRPGRWAGLALALPPCALLVAQLFRQYADLSAEGRHARWWRVGRWPMVGALVAASVGVPSVAYGHGVLIDAGWLAGAAAEPWLASMGWAYWAGAATALLGMSVLSARYAAGHHPGKAVVCWALWTLALTVVLLVPVVRGPYGNAGAAPESVPGGQPGRPLPGAGVGRDG